MSNALLINLRAAHDALLEARASGSRRVTFPDKDGETVVEYPDASDIADAIDRIAKLITRMGAPPQHTRREGG